MASGTAGFDPFRIVFFFLHALPLSFLSPRTLEEPKDSLRLLFPRIGEISTVHPYAVPLHTLLPPPGPHTPHARQSPFFRPPPPTPPRSYSPLVHFEARTQAPHRHYTSYPPPPHDPPPPTEHTPQRDQRPLPFPQESLSGVVRHHLFPGMGGPELDPVGLLPYGPFRILLV